MLIGFNPFNSENEFQRTILIRACTVLRVVASHRCVNSSFALRSALFKLETRVGTTFLRVATIPFRYCFLRALFNNLRMKLVEGSLENNARTLFYQSFHPQILFLQLFHFADTFSTSRNLFYFQENFFYFHFCLEFIYLFIFIQSAFALKLNETFEIIVSYFN